MDFIDEDPISTCLIYDEQETTLRLSQEANQKDSMPLLDYNHGSPTHTNKLLVEKDPPKERNGVEEDVYSDDDNAISIRIDPNIYQEVLLETLQDANRSDFNEQSIPCKHILKSSCPKQKFCRYSHNCQCKGTHTCIKVEKEDLVKDNKVKRRSSYGDSFANISISAGQTSSQNNPKIRRSSEYGLKEKQRASFNYLHFGIPYDKPRYIESSPVYKITTLVQQFERQPISKNSFIHIPQAVNFANLTTCK